MILIVLWTRQRYVFFICVSIYKLATIVFVLCLIAISDFIIVYYAKLYIQIHICMHMLIFRI